MSSRASLALLGATLCSCQAEPVARDARLTEIIGWTQARMDEWAIPGAAIAVVEAGELRHVAGIGFRELGKPELVTPDTLFRVGSLSKLVTGVLATQQSQAGHLDLDAPASQALPGVTLADPDGLSSFSLGHLLSHGSGLEPPGVPNSCGTEPEDLDQLLAERVPGWELWLPPDTIWNYANGNYVLVGAALREATGQDFEDLAHDEFFAPAGLEGATYQPDVAWGTGNTAMGHAIAADTLELVGFRDLDERACTASFPSGGLMIGVRELGKVMEGVLGGGAPWLDDAGYEALVTGGWEFNEEAGYNNGLLRTDYREHRAWTHGGTVGGYLANMILLPDEGLGVVVLVNADHPIIFPPEPGSRSSERIAEHVVDAFLGLEEEPWEDNTRPPEDWERYVGTYRSDFDWGTVRVRLEAGELVLDQGEDVDPIALSPYSRDRFQYPAISGTDGRIWYQSIKFVQEDDRTEWLMAGPGIARRVDEDSAAP